MSSIDHDDFVPDAFASKRKQRPQTTIRLSYDPVNFQHLSLIARMFSRAFVNHSDDGDISGLATVIKALPYITIALPDLQISLQFVAKAENTAACDLHYDADLHPFIDAAPHGIQITWGETLMWRLDTDGKIAERWQTPFPLTA